MNKKGELVMMTFNKNRGCSISLEGANGMGAVDICAVLGIPKGEHFQTPETNFVSSALQGLNRQKSGVGAFER